MPQYFDEVIAALIRFKLKVWQEQEDAKRANRTM
jgi:hypothetical protein